MAIPINISLFAHIELDSELLGRFGVQGNTFRNTFGYLNQYFKNLPETPPQVKKLAVAMEALVEREGYIRSMWWSNKASFALLEFLNQFYEMIPTMPPLVQQWCSLVAYYLGWLMPFGSLDAFALKTTNEINDLPVGKELLIPGGWVSGGGGHAMIYQFEKADNGDLRFSIYNSGSGLQHHAKTSSTEKELFSPVKTYTLPHPVDPTELQGLIKRLVIPQLSPKHPAREDRPFDDETVYGDIGISLKFLNAVDVPQDLNSSKITTAGQISGTCAQRSIHQMLKVNFNNPQEYERFIFDFKLHALKEFIATHPTPRSPDITALIQKAIINNLRILQRPGVFKEQTQQDWAVKQLETLQEQVQTAEQKILSSFFSIYIDFATLIDFFNAFVNLFITNNLATNITKFDSALNTEPEPSPALLPPLHEDTLLADIAEVIKQCKAQQHRNPAWVMTQIERTILQLPIPLSCNREKPYYESIPFYKTITTAEDFETIGSNLDQLHALYRDACEKTLKEATIPTQVVTLCSFMALRDYFDTTGEAVTQLGCFHDYFHRKLAGYLATFYAYPFLGTNNPVSDQRLTDLVKLTHNTPDKGYGPDPLKDYQAFLDEEPELKKSLEEMYDARWLHYRHYNPQLHQALRKDKLTALDALLNEFDDHGQLKFWSALAADRFKPLIQRFQHRFVLEKALISYLDPLTSKERDLGKNKTCREYKSIRYINAEGDKDETFFMRLLGDWLDKVFDALRRTTSQAWIKDYIYINYADYSKPLRFENKQCINRHKYNIGNDGAGRVLDESFMHRMDKFGNRTSSFMTSNQIQLFKSNYFIHDLFQLRLSPAHQIKLTLDYFSKSESINKLSTPEIQGYVEANLFEPGLLKAALHDDPAFFPCFNALIAKGLRHFAGPDGLPGQESLFFIGLRSAVVRYAVLNNRDAVSMQRLQDDFDELNQLVFAQTDSLILATLHRFRFANAMVLHGKQLPEAFLSYAYLQAKQNPYHDEDTTTRFEQQRAGLDFKEWLRTTEPADIEALVELMMNNLKLNITDLTLTGAYPRFHYQDKDGTTVYTVNAELGRVLHNGYSLSAIPLDIKNHSIMQRLGLGKESSCWLSEDEKTILFTARHVRMKKAGETLVVQKQWNDKWYELKPLNSKQQRLFALKSTTIAWNKLPAILTDASIEAWVSETDSLLVQNQKPMYQGDQHGVFHQLDQDGRQTGRALTGSPDAFIKTLSQFESPRFFTTNLDQSNHGTIDFARYDLSLNAGDNKITLPGTHYALMESSALGPNIAALTFSNGIDQQCIVAVQPFYVKPSIEQIVATQPFYVVKSIGQIEGEYYQLIHDISDHIAVMEATGGKPWKEQDLPASNYHHSQRIITYKLVDGTPKPDTAADALYLCYLNLATHETDKAWAVLDDISQRLSLEGSVDELTCLEWIVQKLPVILDKHDADAKLEMPEYVACQLKALALFTDYLTLGQPPAEPTSFYDKLTDIIYTLYTSHQKGKRHLHELYTLRDEECKSLLDYCDPHQTQAIGALGYERRRLSLQTLLKEHQRLVAIKDQVSPAFVKRINDIEKHITHELRVMKKSDKLEWIPFKPARSKVYIDSYELPQAARDVCRQWNYSGLKSLMDANKALGKLNSAIGEVDFIYCFPTYLDIVRSGTPEQIAQLQQFCTQYLITARHDSDANKYQLTNVLYRVLENPEKFVALTQPVKFTLLTVDALTWDVPPLLIPQAKDVFDEILTTNREIWEELSKEMSASEPMPGVEAIYPESLSQLLGMGDAMKEYSARRLGLGPTTEQRAGQLNYTRIQNQRHISETTLNDPVLRSSLRSRARSLQNDQSTELAALWKDIIQQANHAHNASRQSCIKLLAKQRHNITQQELLTLYLHADMALYVEKTGLSRDACLALHQAIHKGVSLEVQHQQTTRLLNALDKNQLHDIGSILMSENIPEAQTDPALMLFQYAENILVRPRQAEALKSLLSAETNVVEKVIMGGGKSKVILPLLAQKKATGLNLVIVEVPRALLATNHVDLNRTSQRLFGQRAHRFEFNRDSDCSPERLESIYQRFTDIMTNKGYLVTTGESMQSLELKYLELLLSRPEGENKIKIWEKQVYWASKITGLIKQRGDAVIDEVHQGLLLKKKLNYTLGDMRAISPELVKHSIALYQFVDVLEGRSPTLDDLLSHQHSPLKPYIEGLDAGELRDYFNNQLIPACIEKADTHIKDALAFYKEQLTLLPKTRARHYKEHYGPSEVQDTALKRAMAIPYFASNQPNERSRFGSPFAFETINYSIQSLLSEGLNEELLQGAIVQWQAGARYDLFMPSSPYHHMAETPTAQRINPLLQNTGLTLQTINLQSETGPQQLKILFEHLKHNRSLLYALLQEQILPQITIEQSILRSDSLNHASMFNKLDGVSGTPSNYTTYHQRLKYNPITALGTDGYIQTVLEKKQTQVFRVPFTNMDAFLSRLFQEQPNLRAIIDISATFAGISNLDVARKLAGQAPSIQYILYFNAADVLCALNTTTQQTMELATSDPDEINRKLGCTPQERITYYDQSHTMGADLKQASNAHAFVLADSRTHLQSFLQGCMRMRGLDEQQTVSVIVPEDTPGSLEDLFVLMAKNEHEQLRDDNFFAALAKMDNLVREDFLLRIADVPDEDIDKKYKLGQAFKRYFVETKNQSLFEQYGNIRTEQLTRDLLEQHQTDLMQDWQACLAGVEIEPSDHEKDSLDIQLDDIVKQSIPWCKDMSLSPVSKSCEPGTEVEHEKELQKEVEKELLKEAMNFNPKLNAAARHVWNKGEQLESFIEHGTTAFMKPLKTAEPMAQIFSENLLVDDNYANVYVRQEHVLCPYVKSVEAILFRKSGDSVTACIIDMMDLAELKGLINTDSDPQVWISDTRHTILEGAFPDGILQNKQYQAFIEQIRLFNGECLSLAEQETWYWLNENTSEKLACFKEHIMPYRQTLMKEFHQLQVGLSAGINNTAVAIERAESTGVNMRFFATSPVTPTVELPSSGRKIKP